MITKAFGTNGWSCVTAVLAAFALVGGVAQSLLADALQPGGAHRSATVTGTPAPGMDRALRASLAGQVAPEDANRPWSVEYGSTALPLAAPNQQAANWCWAATASAVTVYYGAPTSQCSLVTRGTVPGRLLGVCADVPGWPDQQALALSAAGVPARVLERSLTFTEVTAQIDAGRPVIAHVRTGADGSSHAVLVRGYDTSGGLLLAVPNSTRLDEDLAWYSEPDSGVPYPDVVPTPGSQPAGFVAGVGPDASAYYAQGWVWTASVLVAPPGQSPTLTPDPVRARPTP